MREPTGEGADRAVRDEEARLRVALERAAAQWRTTFDAIGSPILVLDLDGKVSRLNDAARQLTGASFQEILGRPVGEIDGGPLWREAAGIVAAVRERKAPLSRQVRDDDRGRTWDVSAHYRGTGPEVDEERVILVARDITPLVELQESLRRSEVMSALGSLVAGVAHQVRNPIFGMTAALDAFEARFGEREEFARYLEALREPLGRLSRLMADLLEYGKPQASEPEPSPLAEIAEEAVAACQPLARGRGVELRRRIAAPGPAVLADPSRLAQAFQNLIENAIQHSPEGGAVEVEVEAGGEGGAVYRVADSGPGFRDEDLPRVFEPFYSRRRGGTGLGLSIVNKIVDEHRGRAKAANRPGGGAVVEIWLPRAEG